MTYEPGQQFRVLQPCYLSGWEHRGGSSFGGTRTDLNVGDIVTVKRYGPTPMTGSVHVVEFVGPDGGDGELSHSSWGLPVKGFLEPVTP